MVNPMTNNREAITLEQAAQKVCDSWPVENEPYEVTRLRETLAAHLSRAAKPVLGDQTKGSRSPLHHPSEDARDLSEVVPTSWLDPLLTGPRSVIPSPGKEITYKHIEALLRAVKARVKDAAMKECDDGK